MPFCSTSFFKVSVYKCISAECGSEERRDIVSLLSAILLCVIMLNDILLSVFLASVILLNVVLPKEISPL
jgi:hypothetical protein